MVQMGFRVIKTAVATLLAIFTADALGIEAPLSAGLLAILGVDVTRKRSLMTVSSRFFASLLGLLMAFVLFYFLGFHFWVLAVYILIAFPILSRAHFKDGIVTSSVVVFRVFGGEALSFHILLTQVELLIIGLGYATLVNFIYMPKSESKLKQLRSEIESLFAVIFKQMAASLRDPYHVWDGKELIEASQRVEEGRLTAHRVLENQMIKPDETWSIYFYMRSQQLERVEYMLELLSRVYQRMPQGEVNAMLFDQLSEDVLNEVYTGQTEEMLHELEQYFKKMELPSSREEFELRSTLLQLCRELDMYLQIAKKHKKPATVLKLDQTLN